MLRAALTRKQIFYLWVLQESTTLSRDVIKHLVHQEFPVVKIAEHLVNCNAAVTDIIFRSIQLDERISSLNVSAHAYRDVLRGLCSVLILGARCGLRMCFHTYREIDRADMLFICQHYAALQDLNYRVACDNTIEFMDSGGGFITVKKPSYSNKCDSFDCDIFYDYEEVRGECMNITPRYFTQIINCISNVA